MRVAMRGLARLEYRHRRLWSSGGRNAHDGIDTVRVENSTVFAPCRTPHVPNGRNDNLDGSSRCRDLLHLTFGEKADPTAVRRPEGVLGVFGPRERLRDNVIEGSPPEQRTSALRSR